MLNIFKKYQKTEKKSPTEIIEKDIRQTADKNGFELERAYVKFPGEELTEVNLEGGEARDSVCVDYLKMIKCMKKDKTNEYTALHTHPGGNFLPSSKDFSNFMDNKLMKTMIIIQTADKKINGYFVIRKTGLTKHIGYNFPWENSKEKELYSDNYKGYTTIEKVVSSLEIIKNRYKLHYRFFQIKRINK